jgi:hypothetical protein
MPQLTFPIVPDLLIADVLVNLEASVLLPLRAAGGSRPPIEAKGIIDTASNVSGVTADILQQLGVTPHGPSSTTGIGGTLGVTLYPVSLHIRDASRPSLPMFTVPSLLLMDFPKGLGADVLIGMDVLIQCKLLVDGPAGEFTISF